MSANLVILHGEDELAISRRLSAILAGLGGSAQTDVDSLRLDGRTVSMSDLETAISTLPFFSSRRAVILLHPLTRLASSNNKEKFLALLGKIPPPILLILIEYKSLTDERARKKRQFHWLEAWATQAGERVELIHCPLPRPVEMPARIQAMVKDQQGKITPEAARQLAVLIGENPRLVDHELQKLLAYVNYSRPIQIEDVQQLTEDQAQGDVFTMVDAMGNRASKQAVNMLHRLLEQQDAISIFGMVVRQFRLLLLTREIIDGRGQIKDVVRLLRLHPFVAEKVYAQAHRFSLDTLEDIYHRVLEMDVSIKTGEIDADLALDTFIASIAA